MKMKERIHSILFGIVACATLVIAACSLSNQNVYAKSVDLPEVTAANSHILAAVGETTPIVFKFDRGDYVNESLTVYYLDSKGATVASTSRNFTSSDPSFMYYVTTWTTTGVPAGTYTISVTKKYKDDSGNWQTVSTPSVSYITLYTNRQALTSGSNNFSDAQEHFTCTVDETVSLESNVICNASSAWKVTEIPSRQCSIQLKEMYIDDEAETIVLDESNKNIKQIPSLDLQWLLMEYEITNNSGSSMKASDLLDYNQFYQYTSTPFTVCSIAEFNGDRAGKTINDVVIAPGEKQTVWMGIFALVSHGMPYLKLNGSDIYLNINPAYYNAQNDTIHDLTTLPAVTATCTSTGLTAGTKCSICGKVLTAQTTTPVDSSNHSWGSYGVSRTPSIWNTGMLTTNCTRCGVQSSYATPSVTPTIKLSFTKRKIKAHKFTVLTVGMGYGDWITKIKANKPGMVRIKKIGVNRYKITGKKKGRVKIVVRLKSGLIAKKAIQIK